MASRYDDEALEVHSKVCDKGGLHSTYILC